MRISLVFALCVTLPLVAIAQRYGGAGRAASLAQPVQTEQTVQTAPHAATPAATPTSRQDRQNDVPLGWQWWKDAEIRKQLQLTDRQVMQISQLYDDRVRQVRPTWEALQKQQRDLSEMGRQRTVDVATYSLHVTNAEGLRSEVNKTRAVLIYAISRRLNAEQFQKLQEIYEKRFRRGGGSGGSRPNR